MQPKTTQRQTPRRIARRRFLETSVSIGAGLALAPAIRAAGLVGDRVVVGVMGLGRGLAHVQACLEIPGFEVAYVCDVDSRRVAVALQHTEGKQDRKVTGVKDFRRVLDDKSVDALSIATCNHWHASATIFACAAGKHVYVEKPGSHDPNEGELMVRAARKHQRVVQMGNQRRSWPGIIEGIEKLRAGAIGPLRYARCWYTNARPSIGHGKPAPVPEYLDYSLWQGPAPERPYKDNLIHYNWHWHWHWGNGELGNNGIHALDLARWGLGVDYPLRVAYTGGRYHYDDDQETPDTGVASYDFGHCGASWDDSSCLPRREEKLSFVTFYGDGGSMAIDGGGYVVHDLDGKATAQGSGPGGDRSHFENFLAAIRDGAKPHSEIEECQKSTLLCHLGNIAYRTGRTIRFDPEKRRIVDCPEAAALWSRVYRDGWQPQV